MLAPYDGSIIMTNAVVVSQHGKDQIMTAKQCTDTDTAASIERLEKAGVIKEDFTRTPATQGMCEEINDRVLLASTPEARALEVERAVQEFRIIRDSMQAADEDLAAGSPAGRVAITPLAFSELPGYQSREEALTAQPTAQDRASSTGAREAIKDGASPEEAYAKAHADGESAGASKPEAAAGAVNAVSIALIAGTI